MVVIDLLSESLVSLHDAARLLPAARGGRRCHLSTLLRWVADGAPGPDGKPVCLEAVRLGGRWLTSREALQRFAVRLIPSPTPDPVSDITMSPTPAGPRTPGQRRRASEAAGEQLDQVGICQGWSDHERRRTIPHPQWVHPPELSGVPPRCRPGLPGLRRTAHPGPPAWEKPCRRRLAAPAPHPRRPAAPVPRR